MTVLPTYDLKKDGDLSKFLLGKFGKKENGKKKERLNIKDIYEKMTDAEKKEITERLNNLLRERQERSIDRIKNKYHLYGDIATLEALRVIVDNDNAENSI